MRDFQFKVVAIVMLEVRSEALAMVVEEAGVFSSNYEFQFIAGSFQEDLGDFPTATKCLCALQHVSRSLTTQQVLLRVCEAQS